jgi:sugar (pentulose or hexulose) kinase
VTASTDNQPATLVLDIGKTNVKVLVMSKQGAVLEVLKTENSSQPAPPYLHLDPSAAWEWLLEAITTLAKSHRIDAIVTTTHGCAAALVDGNDLVLPVMDYEAEPPADVNREFEPLIPAFEETQTPDLPQSLNLARQLFWLQREFPEEFARTREILNYPQYWGWRFSGVAANEVTSVSCHTYLWHPGNQDFTDLTDAQGWRDLFPPMRKAYEPLGSVKPDVAEVTGLPPDCRVFTGVHDSNANFALYLRGYRRPFSLVSTGTWVVIMNPRTPLNELDQDRDTMAITDVEGHPLPTARYMGGRDFELLTEGQGAATEFTETDVLSILKSQSMILPSLTPGGPYMERKSEMTGPEPRTPAETAARATLYIALMTTVSCRLMQTDGDLIIDGGFTNNTWFCRLLAALTGHERCMINTDSQGTAVGAGMLASWDLPESEWPLQLQEIEPFNHPELTRYAEAWDAAL